MWIEQKKYTLKSKGGNITQGDILDNIFLRANDNLTNIPLSKLFIENSKPEFDKSKNTLTIKGWSLLQNIVNSGGDYFPNNTPEDMIKLSLNSELLGDLEIVKIENPLFQANDKELEDSIIEDFNNKILELSRVKPDKEEEEKENPHSETSSDIVNTKYENGKIRYLNNGYKELKDGNFKLLTNDEKNLHSFFNVVSETEVVPYLNVIKNPEGVFEITNEDGKLEFTATIAEDKLKVEAAKENN